MTAVNELRQGRKRNILILWKRLQPYERLELLAIFDKDYCRVCGRAEPCDCVEYAKERP